MAIAAKGAAVRLPITTPVTPVVLRGVRTTRRPPFITYSMVNTTASPLRMRLLPVAVVALMGVGAGVAGTVRWSGKTGENWVLTEVVG